MSKKLRAATRGSKLALWQTNYIASLLDVEIEVVVIQTEGDRTQKDNVPLESIGGQGVFVKEVQAAVLDGRADFAVHSAKDLPSLTPDGLVIACVPERGDARDALVGNALDRLQAGALVATGSVRRRAQLAWLRPDLTFTGLRGNVDTRIKKISECDAVVMAYAPIVRLQMDGFAVDVLDPDVMLPQVAQGALAIECRSGDEETTSVLQSIQHAESRRCIDAERSFLATLGSGCDLPVGAYAEVQPEGGLRIRGMIASLDGSKMLRRTEYGDDALQLGTQCAQRLLQEDGGSLLLGKS